MSNSWFRLYAEFATDPKVQILSEQDQRRLIMIFCMRCNGDVTLQDKHVTFQLRITAEEWAISKGVFIDAGFIDSDNNVLNWDKRQYVSDSSAARVARHRTLHKNVTVTPCNVTVTPPEQNRTDTEQIQKQSKSKPLSEYSDEFIRFWNNYPKKVGKDKAWQLWKKLKPDIADVLKAVSWQRSTEQWINNFIPNPETYLNQGRWKDEPQSSSGVVKVENKCEFAGCTRTANTRTARGHRCVDHISK